MLEALLRTQRRSWGDCVRRRPLLSDIQTWAGFGAPWTATQRSENRTNAVRMDDGGEGTRFIWLSIDWRVSLRS